MGLVFVVGCLLTTEIAVANHQKLHHHHPLLDLSLEELFELEVTTASRKPEPLVDVASAVYIISSEQIRRSSAAAVPELLRMAPGVDVRRIDASHWAVSVRGFNGDFVSNLLVLLDGVSVYRPTFSGVNWDELDIDLANIERIEVVRGPGAATWGVNAVNGVINIITRSAATSQGTRVSVLAGDNLRPAIGITHGGRLNDRVHYKVSSFFRGNDRSDGENDHQNFPVDDGWYSRRLEVRGDARVNGQDHLTLLARGWNSQRRQISDVFSPRAPVRSLEVDGAEMRGGTVTLGLQQQISGGSRHWQANYYQRSRDERRFTTRDKTVELEITQLQQLSQQRERVWGVGYRHLDSDMQGSFSLWADPEKFSENLFTAFFQESWGLSIDGLALTLGSKFEHSDWHGFNAQPSLKVSYRIDPRSSIWGSVSRAKRTPSRLESHGQLLAADLADSPLPVFLAFQGQEKVDAETLIAYEIGARHLFGSRASVDATLFLHDYNDLIGIRPNTDIELQAVPLPHGLVVVPFENPYGAQLYGFEVSSSLNVTADWQIKVNYSWSKLDGITAPQNLITHDPPEQIFNLNSYYSLNDDWEFDANLRYTDRDTALVVDGWWSLDLRLGWQLSADLKVSLVAKDLLMPDHFEYNDSIATEVTSVGHSAFLRLDWSL